MANHKKIIAIVGPTASGKTALAVKIAREFNGEIVSADSRQVYRGLDLGTGKEGARLCEPNAQGERSAGLEVKKLRKNWRMIDDIPQWMIDVAETGKRFTLFDWLGSARLVIEDIFKRGKVPIVVGGTGLYVQALIEGFTLKSQKEKGKRKNHNVKVKSFQREELEKLPREKLVGILQKLDPTRLEEIDSKNPRRLIRAIELSQGGSQSGKIKPDFEALQIGIGLPRLALYQKIDQRVEKRFAEGMLKEVGGLLAKGVDPKWLIGLGLEYKIIGKYVLSHPKLEARSSKLFSKMQQELKYKSHGYARRQLTWFRRFPEIKWVRNFQEAKRVVGTFLKVGKAGK